MTRRSPNESLLAIRFEAVGSTLTKSGGVLFYFGHPQQGLSLDYDWWPALAEEPGSVRAEVNPFTGDWSVSSADFRLSASDRVASLLMADQRDPAYNLVGEISATATSATVSAAGINTGDVIWIGDEAIYVGSASGTSLSSLTRGYWGSEAQSHEDEEQVYDAVPYWRSRRVDLIEVDADGTQTIRWRGLVEDIVAEDAVINVRCTELLSALASAEVNAEGTEIGPGDSKWVGDRLEVYLPRVTVRTLRPGLANGRSLLFQIDDALVPLIFSSPQETGRGTLFAELGVSGLSDVTTLLGSRAPDAALDGGTAPVERVYELLAWVRQSGTGAGANGYTPFPAGQVPAPFHPLAVALALLTSTGRGDNGDYDILGTAWSIGVDYLDFARWESEIDATQDLVIDRLILGWDGESVNPFDVVREVLRPYGYYLVIEDNGLLYPARLRMVNEADANSNSNEIDLLPVDGGLSMDRGLSLSTSAVRGRVGRTPWDPGRAITVRDPRRSRRQANLLDPKVHEIDLSVFDPSRIITSNEIDEIVTPFVGLLGLGLDTAPILRGRISDYRKNSDLDGLDLGRFVQVSDLGLAPGETWLVLPDGTRVEIDATDVRWLGILVAREWIPRDNSYGVGVLLINWRDGVAVKERAPSAVVGTGSTTTVIELDDTEDHGTAPGDAFWTAADGSGSGDSVRIVDENGVDLGYGTAEVASATATALTLGTALSTAPSAGDVVRLVQSSGMFSDKYASTKRPYTYLALDPTTSIEDADTDEGPDIYGTALFGGSGQAMPSAPTFLPIDNDAINGGVIETTCEPYDSWLAYRLRNNTTEIISRGHQVSWVPRTGNAGSYSTDAGHRPYTSVNFASVLFVPWLCEPGLAEVTLGYVARVSSESATAGDVSGATMLYSLELDGRATSGTLTSTDGDSPEFQPGTITLDFSGRPFEREEIRNLRLYLEADLEGLAGSTATRSDANFGAFTIGTASGSPYDEESITGQPAVDDLSLQASTDDQGSYFDHLKRLDDRRMVVGATGGASSSSSLTVRHLPYVQFRSIEVQQGFVDASLPTDESLRPAQPVYAETDVLLNTRPRRHYRRARPVWIGPQGVRPYDAETTPESWPQGYTQRFPVIAGDVAATSEVDLFDAGIWLDTPDPDLLVLFNVIPTRVLPLGDLIRGTEGTPKQGPLTLGDWRFWLVVEQLEDGDADWSAATEVGTSSANRGRAQLAHWACYADSDYPTLLAHGLRESEGWPYKEGQVFRSEEVLVQSIALPLNLDYDHTTDRPLRVTVRGTLDSVQWNYGSGQTNSALDLIVVGASIWEQPS